jgi:SagB-type dehydrogenase family enzyme
VAETATVGAAEYHRATKHSWWSVRLGARPLDWRNRPCPFKRYQGLDSIPLPTDWPADVQPAATVLSQGRGPGGRVDAAVLAKLLFCAAGITRQLHGIAMRAAASAGALYPVEVYLTCGSLDGLEPGVYHFDPERFGLHPLRLGDFRVHLAEAVHPDLASMPASLVLTGIPWRTAWKYRERGFRHLYWDGGTVLANLMAAADGAGVAARAVTAFVDRSVAALLGLGEPGTPEEFPLAVVPLGTPEGPGPPRRGAIAALGLEVEPLSARPVPCPLITAAQRAGELHNLDQVRRWRERARALRGLPATVHVVPTGPGPGLEEVVLHRGSTRRFRPDPVPRPALVWAMAAATRPVVGDFVAPGHTLLQHDLIVHAVDEIDPGTYRWAPEGLQPLARGDFRRQAAALCLDQPLGGQGAYTAFHRCRLEPLLEALGSRGYRAAQLEAGVVSGRLQLAVFALGVGATCLTFYDDAVAGFFRSPAETMLVTACGFPAYRARPGRRPG